MKVFLTGASGMLAAEVIPQLKKQGAEVTGTDRVQRLPEVIALDVTDREAVRAAVGKDRPDIIYHLAAETNVDRCEQEPDHAFAVNTIGTENLALMARELDVPLVFISSGAVFSGVKRTPHTEYDETGPVNVYGRSKVEAEKIVMSLLGKYYICRAGWMIGGWDLDKKFVFKIITQIIEGKTALQVVSDKFGNPTFTRDFARKLLEIASSGQYGLYHLANKGTASRYDIARKIVELMGLSETVTVEKIPSSRFPLPAPRADSEMMVNYHLELLGLNDLRTWEECLAEYIRENHVPVSGTK